MKYDSLTLRFVTEMPLTLESGILYVSKQFKVAGHLCACGCGNKVIVPLGNPGFSFTENDGLPTLYPSIGSWQLPCQSHYFITDGHVDWCKSWSPLQIEAGRKAEQRRLKEYYQARIQERKSLFVRLLLWFRGL